MITADIKKIIAEVLELDKKATPGPWDREPGTYGNRITCQRANYDFPKEIQTVYIGTRDKLSDSYNFWDYEDSVLIANYRESAPLLAKALEREIRAGEIMREALDNISCMTVMGIKRDKEEGWTTKDWQQEANKALDEADRVREGK